MKVLIAIDDSPYSSQVIESVISRRWPINAEFKILTVLEPISSFNGCSTAECSKSLSSIDKQRRQAAERLGEKVRQKFESAMPATNVHCDIRAGLPRAEIINAAVDWSADKIIVGAHGRDVCPRYLIGSVSRAVATHAPCSVEIIRPRAYHKRQTAEARPASAISR